ncbi:Hrf1 family protein [Cardiosporidium cionae]|uniref:Hrf1 family protein n=1 Tax=Cardiosporidium cionae TaxID=476202 RepID=A0ABQ7JAS6_9APIC|nr:Hrf1 family protein [Cardiosporidium cionae]|eukprot:KAF8821024.1 Hrf1 family protein [Cardiosporidium cionae]
MVSEYGVEGLQSFSSVKQIKPASTRARSTSIRMCVLLQRNFPPPRGHAEQGHLSAPSAAERLNPYAATRPPTVYSPSGNTVPGPLTGTPPVPIAKNVYYNTAGPSRPPMYPRIEYQSSVWSSPASLPTSQGWPRNRGEAPANAIPSSLGTAPEFVASPSAMPPLQGYSLSVSGERSRNVGMGGPSTNVSATYPPMDGNLSSAAAGQREEAGGLAPSKTPFPMVEESRRAAQMPSSSSVPNPMSNALAQMVMSSMVDRVGMDSIPMSKLHAFFPSAVMMLRQYFNVSHKYVFKKLLILLCPYIFLIHSHWKSIPTRTRLAGQVSSQHDIVEENQMQEESASLQVMKRADLYIPLMALITYILAIGLTKGTSGNDFRPDVLGSAATFSLTLIALEVIVTKAAFYLSGNSFVTVMDLIAYSGYKFVHLVLIICVGILIGLTSSTSSEILETSISSGGRLIKGSTYSPPLLKYSAAGDAFKSKAASGDFASFAFPKTMNRHSSTLFWCCFLYFTVCAVIEMLQCLTKPLQTGTASELELRIRRSSSYYIAWILAFAQIPLCYVLMPSISL